MDSCTCSQATLRTVDLLVLGSQHSPSLFHQCVPYLTQLLDRVKDEGDLLTNDARAYSQFIGTRLQPAVVFAFVGLRLFPGFPALYEPLVSRLSQYPPPSDGARPVAFPCNG